MEQLTLNKKIRRFVGPTVRPLLNALFRLTSVAVAIGFFVYVGLIYLIRARRYFSNPKKNQRPRLFWGVTPMINFKYFSLALKEKGYDSQTIVSGLYPAFDRKDYDLYLYELSPYFRSMSERYRRLIAPYYGFVYALSRFDIFHFSYDGGILSLTRFWQIETHLLHRFGKKVAVMPYGSDVHVPRLMRNNVYKFGQMYHYGYKYFRQSWLTEKKIDHFTRYADFCMGTVYFDAVARWDMLPVNYLCIDTNQWMPASTPPNLNDGKNAAVRIVHSPNHRVIKGTDYLIEAINKLKAEGYKIDFRLLEGKKNSEVREELRSCDILVELLISGYGLSGIEGMSLGKPVISNFQTDVTVLRRYSFLDECPIVIANFDTIYEKLKWLIETPATRHEIGRKSQSYVKKYHSFFSHQIIWGRIYDKIWFDEKVDLLMFFHPLYDEYSRIYESLIAAGLKERAYMQPSHREVHDQP